jgi:hypothetical protein
MLKLAIDYETELNKIYRENSFNAKYKYYYIGAYKELSITIDKDNWTNFQFVSVDNNNNVIGFLCAKIDRNSLAVGNLSIINYSDNKLIFGIDLLKFIKIIKKTNLRKISFYVIIGNPIEKQYDKLINLLNGRIVGIQKEHVQLQDNKYYDIKLYEIIF